MATRSTRADVERSDGWRSSNAVAADLVVDATRLRVTRNDEAIDLTPTEFQLLATLARHPGRVFTRAQLLDAVRGSDVDSFERAIDTHIKNIRRKPEID